MGPRIAHAGVSRFFHSDGTEILFDRGERAYVYDIAGTPYLDLILGFGPVILGHVHPDFQKQVTELWQHGFLMPGYTKSHYIYLDRLLGSYGNIYLVSFFKTASEAVSASLRLAAIATGKKGVIRCGYIGWHDVLLGQSAHWHEPPNSPLRPRLRWTAGTRGIGPGEAVLNWIDLEINELENLISPRTEQIGAFVIDAYQLSFMNRDIVRRAVALCRDHDILVVFDETKTGGRVSRLGLAIDEEIEADMIVLGKSLANGAPISLLLGREQLLNYSEYARIGGTFSKECFAIYCALATLDIMETVSGFDALKRIGQRIVTVFNVAAQQAGVATLLQAQSVFGGSMFDLRFLDGLIADMSIRQKLPRYLADHNILLLQGHPSFVCLDHDLMDWGYFEEHLVAGLSDWGKSIG